MKKLFAIIFILILIQAAEAREWRNIGPEVANVDALIPDRNNPSLWFLVTQAGTLYRSVDLGNRWKPVLSHITNAMVHPITSEVFAWDYRRIWKSTDSGKTFDLWSSEYQPQRIIPHPTDPNTFLGLSYESLLGSGNSGRTWVSTEVYRLPEDEYGDYYYSVEDALFSPFDPNTIYATFYYEYGRYDYGSFLLVTYNRGRTWRVLKRKAEFRFHYDPAFPNRAFATDGKSFYQLSKNGSWDLISQIETYFGRIISIPGHPEQLISYTSERILQSQDTGKTWQEFPNQLGPSLGILAAADDMVHTLLAGTPAGVFKRSKGSSWQLSSSGLKEPSVVSVVRSGSKLLAGIYGTTTFSFDIPTSSWTPLLSPRYTNYYFHPTNPLHFFRAVYTGAAPFGYLLQGTLDGGKTWYRVGLFESAIYDQNNPDTVYFEGEDGIFHSSDEGKSVTPLPVVVRFSKTFSEGENGKVLYFFQPYSGIWKSTDGGRTIRRADAGIDSRKLWDMVSLGPPRQFLVINKDKEIFQTFDGGEHWEKISQIERPQHVERNAPHVALIRGPSASRLFAVAYQRLYETLDQGKTWKEITHELGPNLRIIDMANAEELPLAVATNKGIFLGR